MEHVLVKKVTTKHEMTHFVKFTESHYACCPQFVPDMEQGVRDFFDPEKNPNLECADVQPFVAYRNDVPVGRIAGIINHKANEKWNTRNVRFSLIEFVDDIEVSKALIEAVAQWGREHGMERIQGPMGIIDFDKEGMLVEDFDMNGSASSIYNFDYYPRHLEALGFQKEVDWVQVRIAIPKEVPARYARVAQYAREQIGLRVRKVKRSEVGGEIGHKAFKLFNAAYSPLFGFSELSDRQIEHLLHVYAPLLYMPMVPIVENQDGELVGVAITLPSMADALRRAHGRLWPMGWARLLDGLKWHRSDTAEMLLVAVRPDYQGMGVNALFFDDLIPVYNQCGIKWAETGPQLENNVRELNQWKPLHPQIVKRRRCYTKEIVNK